jgi:YD repeat-containing protein
MTRSLLALLALSIITGAASAQQRTFYDSRGNVVGRSATDSQGSTTNYDARRKVISRESTSGNTTTIYDAGGRNVDHRGCRRARTSTMMMTAATMA